MGPPTADDMKNLATELSVGTKYNCVIAVRERICASALSIPDRHWNVLRYMTLFDEFVTVSALSDILGYRRSTLLADMKEPLAQGHMIQNVAKAVKISDPTRHLLIAFLNETTDICTGARTAYSDELIKLLPTVWVRDHESRFDRLVNTDLHFPSIIAVRI